MAYDIGKVKGGAVILEAAVFDNATYAGNERAAAYLLANQIGNQGEFDRIVYAVETVMARTGPQNVSKTTRLNWELSGLLVDADSSMMATFGRWFPNLRDCVGRFPQAMQSVASDEKANVLTKLQLLLPLGDAGDANLPQWWSETQKYLAAFGCTDCAARMASPSPPVQPRTISVGCSGQTSGAAITVLAVEVIDDFETDDDSGGDGTDQVAANDANPNNAAPDDSAGPDSSDDQLSMTEEPADADAAATSATAVAPATASVPAAVHAIVAGSSVLEMPPELNLRIANGPVGTVPPRRIPLPPILFPFDSPRAVTSPVAERTGIAAGASPQTLPPVTDDQLYQRYFRYVTAWERYLSAGGTPPPRENAGLSPNPYPAKMADNKQVLVSVAASEYEDAMQQARMEHNPDNPFAGAPRVSAPATWADFQEQEKRMQFFLDRRNAREEFIKVRIDGLKLRLGKTSFNELNEYVHGLYHSSAGQRVREPVSGTAMYSSYLHRIASMDQFAANAGDDGRAAATARTDEQKLCQLSDREQTLLQQVADDFQKDIDEHLPKVVLPRAGPAADREAPTAAMRSANAGFLGEERKRIVDLHVERLQSGLEDGFEKLEKRAQALYESRGFEPEIAIGTAEPQGKASGPPKSVQ